MTGTADNSRDISIYLQELRNSLDEIFCILQTDEEYVRQEWKRLEEERERMLVNLTKLELKYKQKNSQHYINASHNDKLMQPIVENEEMNKNDQIIDTLKSENLPENHVENDKICSENAIQSVKHRPINGKGLRSDVIDLISPTYDDFKLNKYSIVEDRIRSRSSSHNNNNNKTEQLNSFLSNSYHSTYANSKGEANSLSENYYHNDALYLNRSNSSRNNPPERHRVPGIISTLGRAQLRVAPNSSSSVVISNSHIASGLRHSQVSIQQDQTFWIHIWPCFSTFGSSMSRPTRIVVHGSYRYMEQLTEKAGIATGCQPAPSVLYEPDGRPIRSLAQLIPEQHYLLFPSGAFYRKEAVPAALLEELVRAAKLALRQRTEAQS